MKYSCLIEILIKCDEVVSDHVGGVEEVGNCLGIAPTQILVNSFPGKAVAGSDLLQVLLSGRRVQKELGPHVNALADKQEGLIEY